jgi:hypothetical protein
MSEDNFMEFLDREMNFLRISTPPKKENKNKRDNNELILLLTTCMKYDKNGNSYTIRVKNQPQCILEKLLFIFDFDHECNNDYKITSNKRRILGSNMDMIKECELQHITMRKKQLNMVIRGINPKDVAEIYKAILSLIE